MEFTLLVIRTKELKQLVDFYSLFGLQFVFHQHGNSPFHYSTYVGQVLLEIYPLSKKQEVADTNLRLGFSISDFDATMDLLKSSGIVFVSEPMETEFGVMAIVCDPDGRRIELYKKF